jgi:raffinose/stachyose/melibiose transport system substrate-binding protein
MKNRFLVALAVVLLGTVALAQNLTILVDDSELAVNDIEALTQAYSARNPDVSFDIELRPGGAEGDNIVKTRLATGDMTDIFTYNSGSLLQALNPSQTLLDLSGQPFLDNVVESFIPVVSQGDAVYGVPFGTGMGGGILYNKAVYEDLGLEVPLTWEDFVANNLEC